MKLIRLEHESNHQPISSNLLKTKNPQYATYKLTLKVLPKKNYAFAYTSASYAMNLYIDNELVTQVGKVGTSPQDSIAQQNRCQTFFTPENETVDVVIQVANFVHEKGGNVPYLMFGMTDDIVRYEHNNYIRAGFVSGSLLISGISS